MKINYDNLLDNAKDFLASSIKSYQDDDYKNAIVSLWSGILLLLKCQIYNIHPILLATDILDCLEVKISYSLNYESLEELISSRKFTGDEIESIRSTLNIKYASTEELLNSIGISNEKKKEI